MKRIKILFLLAFVSILAGSTYAQLIPEVPRGIQYPSATESTMDAAYEAPAKMVVGTWIGADGNNQLTFKADGTGVVKTYGEERMTLSGLLFGTQFPGTWKKTGNNLKFTFRPSSSKYFYDKEEYANLSARLKAEFDKAIAQGNKRIKSLHGSDDFKFYIIYLDENFMAFREEIAMGYYKDQWFINENYLNKFK